ncbi:MAG: lipopolysaccharide biosynthesis protein [Verrucomicrobia bacterium]|nr:lipopolysaccharide biosynthesis protein [Verrucomicrobiota bacterium]
MSTPPSIRETEPASSGREHFGRNVAFTWGAYMVNVVSGFIVPRMISDHLGQTTLGIWDFSWSLVSYFGLVELGFGNSISRYVAGHRARKDVEGLNRSVSTIAIFQRSVAWLALVLVVIAAWCLLPLFGARLGDELGTARWVLLFQGTEIAIIISLSVYGSVIAGCHRWDLQNTVTAIANGLVALAMITVLLHGGGLPALALVHCVITAGSALVRKRLTQRICPELVIKRHLASWLTFVEQARYGIKSLVPSVANLLSNQALSLLIVAFLGPASLAIFSRSKNLVTALRALAARFGMIVVPIASALQARNNWKALRETLLATPAIISSLALPALFTIGILGNQLMQLWMGKAYVLSGMIPILAIGTYATLVQEPVWSLLSGMNRHGRIAIANLGAAVGSALLLTVGLWYLHWGLLGAAVCFALPQMLVDGLVTPWYACRVVGLSKRLFLWRVFVRPLCCVMPYAMALGGAAMIFVNHPFEASGMMILGSLLSAWAYLRWLISQELKKRFLEVLRRVFFKREAETCL